MCVLDRGLALTQPQTALPAQAIFCVSQLVEHLSEPSDDGDSFVDRFGREVRVYAPPCQPLRICTPVLASLTVVGLPMRRCSTSSCTYAPTPLKVQNVCEASLRRRSSRCAIRTCVRERSWKRTGLQTGL